MLKILGTIVQNLARYLCASAITKIGIHSVDYHFGNILRMGVMNEVPCASCFLCCPRILIVFLSSFCFQRPFSVMFRDVSFCTFNSRFRNARARLPFPLAFFSSHDCKHLEKCPACALFLSKNSIQCINVTTDMAYNSFRSLDTIILLVNAADSTLCTADLIAMTVGKKQTPCPSYLTYCTQSTPARQLHQLLQRPKTNKRAITQILL